MGLPTETINPFVNVLNDSTKTTETKPPSANTVDRDTLITYAAEMNFINNQADGLVDFINSLVN